ncbi:MAG: ABC transporter permease [Chitinivibrionales bacterium]
MSEKADRVKKRTPVSGATDFVCERLKVVYEICVLYIDTLYELLKPLYYVLFSVLNRAGIVRSKPDKHTLSWAQVSRQILFTGVDAFPIILLLGTVTGVTIVVQAIINMPELGVGEYFGKIMVLTIIRELGPFLTSIVVIGRSGAALAVFIGNMQVSGELDALKVMGINLVNYTVLPAFIGMIVSIFLLNIYFDIFSILGGVLIANFFVDVPFVIFVKEVLDTIEIVDLLVPAVKTLIYGSIISIISCYYGLRVYSVRIVPRAVFKSVISSILVILIINFFAMFFFYV